ncbi:MAG: IS66 family transposase [Pseudonocardiaceae bacterium]
MSAPEPPELSYQELAALVAGLVARVGTLEAENATLAAENVELRRRVGMNSANSSTPPSKDSIEAKAKRRADRSSRERSKDRKPGGQPGHKGSGLAPTMAPDRTETLPPPGECRGCGGDLGDAADAGMSWAQVWDILAVTLEKVHYLLPRRRCGCGKTTTAAPPFGATGTVVYGPNLNAAAILLASEGNVPIERTAALMAMMLGVPVSAGFVARALERFAQRLAACGFDEAMKTALRAEDVLCADETPTNVISPNTDEHGQPLPGAPHAVTVRTPDARLVWYMPIGSRSKTAIAGLGVLDGYAGYLVRDDYAGWHQFDTQLAGVQQCAAHLIRHAKGVLELHPTQQQWASEVITVLREAAAAATDAHDQIDPQLLADLRARYDHAVAWGIITNRHRGWTKGNHPGYNLAKRLADKAEQVWTFTRNLAVPWTNNSSEQALKGPKRHQAVSGYWHTLTTLADYCRSRSYLVSARNHGVRPIDAIHHALTGNPWLPTASTA